MTYLPKGNRVRTQVIKGGGVGGEGDVLIPLQNLPVKL